MFVTCSYPKKMFGTRFRAIFFYIAELQPIFCSKTAVSVTIGTGVGLEKKFNGTVKLCNLYNPCLMRLGSAIARGRYSQGLPQLDLCPIAVAPYLGTIPIPNPIANPIPNLEVQLQRPLAMAALRYGGPSPFDAPYTFLSLILANFVSKFSHFRCHGNRGRSDVKFHDTSELPDIEDPLFGATTMALCIILAELWHFLC